MTFVQGTGQQSSGSVASLAKAFGSNVVAGNTLVVGAIALTNANNLPAGAFTDTQGNTYQIARQRNTATADVAIAYATASASGACTVTVDPTGGNDFISIGIAEIAPASVDVANDGAATSAAPATGNLVTSASTIILGIMTHNSGNRAITPGATYTQIAEDEDTTEMPFNWEYKIVAAGTYTADWTVPSTPWICIAAAFKDVVSGRVARPLNIRQAVTRASYY